MKLRDLFEDTKVEFYADDSQWDEDGLMVLVRNLGAIDWPDEKFDSYHGINVVFSKKKGEIQLVTVDKIADEEAKKYREQIIKTAKAQLSKDDWAELLRISS